MCCDLGGNTHDWSLVAWCSPRVLGSYWKDASLESPLHRAPKVESRLQAMQDISVGVSK